MIVTEFEFSDGVGALRVSRALYIFVHYASSIYTWRPIHSSDLRHSLGIAC
jgi:hypothetical protein